MLLGSNSRDRYSKEFAAVDLEIKFRSSIGPVPSPLHTLRVMRLSDLSR